MQSKIPGLGVFYRGGNSVAVTWFKGFSLYGEEKSEPDIFLDGVVVNLASIADIPVSSIAYVKAFRPPFVGSFFNGANGAIAIYTKKGYNPVYENNPPPNLAGAILEGYTKYKEFIQPDYENNKNMNYGDYRSTVYWNPYVLTDKSNPRTTISFYNNDISKKLFLVLEGVNLQGKIARVVKLIE